MKNLAKRLSLIVAMAAALALMAFGFAACGETAEAKNVKEVYTANGTLAEMGTEYDIKMNTSRTLTLYTDNTFELVTSVHGYMGAYGNSQVTKQVTVWIGTYTFTESTEEDGVATVVLSKPTRIISNNTTTSAGTVYIDTDDAATLEEGKTGAAYIDENGKELTLTVSTEQMTITAGLE